MLLKKLMSLTFFMSSVIVVVMMAVYSLFPPDAYPYIFSWVARFTLAIAGFFAILSALMHYASRESRYLQYVLAFGLVATFLLPAVVIMFTPRLEVPSLVRERLLVAAPAALAVSTAAFLFYTADRRERFLLQLFRDGTLVSGLIAGPATVAAMVLKGVLEEWMPVTLSFAFVLLVLHLAFDSKLYNIELEEVLTKKLHEIERLKRQLERLKRLKKVNVLHGPTSRPSEGEKDGESN